MATGQSRNYQTISQYSGTLYGQPEYQGLEYDWESPINQVIGSPGGVSTIHHHWTHGFNGRGNTSSDIYAGQGARYIAGVYGNLYQTGQEAGQYMGYYPAAPDTQYWQNQEPQQYSYSDSQASMWAPDMKIYGEPGSYQTTPQDVTALHYGPNYAGTQKKSIEGYESSDADFEWIEQSDGGGEIGGPEWELDGNPDGALGPIEEYTATTARDGTTIILPTIKPWVLFLFFILAFIAFDLWAQATHLFVKQHFHGGAEPPWKRALIYAVVATLLFMLVIYLAGVPLATFESP